MATKTYDFSRPPFEACPRFSFCEINKCILHSDFLKLNNDPSDPSKKKKAKCIPKSIRLRIGNAFKLKNKGLRPRELNASKQRDDAEYSLGQVNSNLHTKNEKLHQNNTQEKME